MNSTDPTLQERASRTYRRLLILRRVFQRSIGVLDEQGQDEEEAALYEGLRDMISDAGEDTKVISTVPLPFSEWRSGDDPHDRRWRMISQLERREVRELVLAYEELIDSCQTLPRRRAATDQPELDVQRHREIVTRFKTEAAFLLPDVDEPQSGVTVTEPARGSSSDARRSRPNVTRHASPAAKPAVALSAASAPGRYETPEGHLRGKDSRGREPSGIVERPRRL